MHDYLPLLPIHHPVFMDIEYALLPPLAPHSPPWVYGHRVCTTAAQDQRLVEGKQIVNRHCVQLLITRGKSVVPRGTMYRIHE
jgi:hypothetical protein